MKSFNFFNILFINGMTVHKHQILSHKTNNNFLTLFIKFKKIC